jgi:hypothetical protein
MWGRGEVYTGFWLGNLRESTHLEDPGRDGRIKLNGKFDILWTMHRDIFA